MTGGQGGILVWFRSGKVSIKTIVCGKKIITFLIIYPVVNHFAALAGDDGFGVILDTSDGESCVVEGHDVTFFVEGADTEAWGERVRVHYP